MQRYMRFADARGRSTTPEKMVISLDGSASMDFADWPPTRLAGAQEALGRLLDVKADLYPDDLVGLVTYSRSARVLHALVPVGTHLRSLKRALCQVRTGYCTNITAGLEEAGKLLNGHQPKRRGVLSRLSSWVFESESVGVDESDDALLRIILVSDGAHNSSGSPLRTADELKSRTTVCIDTIGIAGSHDASELDESLLKSIASVGPDGLPRYAFIADKDQLIKELESKANRIKAV